MKRKKRILLLGDIVGMAAAVIVFVFPFLFMFVNSLKDRREANLLSMALPVKPLWSNYKEVFESNNYIILTAFKNSLLLTVFSLCGLVFVCSMAGYVSSEKAGTHHVFCKLYYHDGTNDSTGYTANDLDHAGTAYI